MLRGDKQQQWVLRREIETYQGFFCNMRHRTDTLACYARHRPVSHSHQAGVKSVWESVWVSLVCWWMCEWISVCVLCVHVNFENVIEYVIPLVLHMVCVVVFVLGAAVVCYCWGCWCLGVSLCTSLTNHSPSLPPHTYTNATHRQPHTNIYKQTRMWYLYEKHFVTLLTTHVYTHTHAHTNRDTRKTETPDKHTHHTQIHLLCDFLMKTMSSSSSSSKSKFTGGIYK